MVLARWHRLALEMVLLALVAYLTAFGVSATVRSRFDTLPAPATEAVAPAPAAPAPLGDYAVIAERDLFNPSPATGSAGGGEARLRLWGVAFEGREARAVIEDTATHHQELYRVGDRVGGARVAAIDWAHVTLVGPGGETILELRPAATAPPADAGALAAVAAEAPDAAPAGGRIRRTGEDVFLVDRRELVGAADDLGALLTQLRAVAEIRDGRPAGFRLFQIRDDSLFARLGLRNGDVVQRVNGRAIGEPAALLAFLDRLRNEPRVALDIVRRETPRTLVYDLR